METRGHFGSPGVGVTGGCELLLWVLKMNLGSLNKQCMPLTAKPSLQPRKQELEMFINIQSDVRVQVDRERQGPGAPITQQKGEA